MLYSPRPSTAGQLQRALDQQAHQTQLVQLTADRQPDHLQRQLEQRQAVDRDQLATCLRQVKKRHDF